MDLVDKIEATSFLGREFLLWLCFECEAFEGTLSVPGLGAIGAVFEKQITLTEEPESCMVKSAEPVRSSETREAIRRGKLPIQVFLRITIGEQDIAFRWAADSRGLSSVALRGAVKGDVEQQFYDRMLALEELEGVLDALYAMFLSLRLSASWASTVAPAMRDWVRAGTTPGAAYRSARKSVTLLTATTKRTAADRGEPKKRSGAAIASPKAANRSA